MSQILPGVELTDHHRGDPIFYLLPLLTHLSSVKTIPEQLDYTVTSMDYLPIYGPFNVYPSLSSDLISISMPPVPVYVHNLGSLVYSNNSLLY